LCAKCFDEKCNNCTHNDEERSLLGTWTIDEVSKALEKGYSVVQIYEVCHFKEKSNSLFKEYLKNFMKIKLETFLLQNEYKTIQEYITAIKTCYDRIEP
jgi:hypothetical protein